jgi:bifunctional DNA-binding transcriptional regulator/antitoxin component of YhaV-PrlF toxin-antitoxin module
MSNIVSITSQGQISIPAKIRRLLDLDTIKKAYLTQENGRIIIDPIKNVIDSAGSLNKYAIKNVSSKDVLSAEKQAIKSVIVKKFQKKTNKNSELITLKP